MVDNGFQFGIEVAFGILAVISILCLVFVLITILEGFLKLIYFILELSYDLLKQVFSTLKWNRFFAKNPDIKAKIIAAIKEEKDQQTKLIFHKDEIQNVAKKTGYPEKWIEEATREFYKNIWEKERNERKQRKKQEALAEKQRLNALAKSWWQFWK
jgi:DNA-directed RNA polymerase subunit E'/Rpb7